MKYDLDRVHQPKIGRRGGATTSQLMNVIGKVMVTNAEVIPFVVWKMDRVRNMKPMFRDIVVSHFNEEPIYHSELTWGIKGYNSIIKFMSYESAKRELLGLSIEPTFDLD